MESFKKWLEQKFKINSQDRVHQIKQGQPLLCKNNNQRYSTISNDISTACNGYQKTR